MVSAGRVALLRDRSARNMNVANVEVLPVANVANVQARKHLASHVLGVLGVLGVLVRPLENEIPCGRPANWKRLEMNGNLPVAGVGAWLLRGIRALAKTPRTPKTPRTVPEKCGASRIGERPILSRTKH